MTFLETMAVGGALLVVSTSAHAQTQPITFDQAAYITCREAQNMQTEARKALAVFLAEHAARRRGVAIPDNELGAQLAHLVRGGCTLVPEAYLFTVIDRAITAELSNLPKRS
jgi:HdeA/HdeB family